MAGNIRAIQIDFFEDLLPGFHRARFALRYLAIEPKRKDKIERIEFVKGPDDTAPIVMAVTVEPLE